jgi:hypothetical protein
MAEEKPRSFHFHLDASQERLEQADRTDRIQEIIGRLAEELASLDNNRPEEMRDVVERKHVRQAAEKLFAPDLSWLSALSPGAGVFLSYSTKDEDFARELGDDLHAAGVAYFLAPLSIKPGATWPEEIWHAIRACRVFVLIVTADAIKSKWCLLEIGAAIGLNKTIIAVQRHSARLPDLLKPLQAIKVQTKKQQAALVARLVELCR